MPPGNTSPYQNGASPVSQAPSPNELERQARRALEFLNLPWDPAVLAYRDRLQTKPVNSPTYEAVRQPLYTRAIGRWRNYEKHFSPHLDCLQPLIKAFGYANTPA